MTCVALSEITEILYIFSSLLLVTDGIPLDGIPRNVTTTVGFPLMVVMDILAFSGVGFAIVCLSFNILFRKRK